MAGENGELIILFFVWGIFGIARGISEKSYDKKFFFAILSLILGVVGLVVPGAAVMNNFIILYLAAVFPLAKHPVLCVVIGILLTALLMIWIFQRITAKKAFKIFGVIYIGAIVLLNCVAASNLITSPSAFTAVFVAGSLLFLISDIVLILNTFGPESRFRLRITNISLGIVAEYLWRAYDAARGRPCFIIADQIPLTGEAEETK